MAAVLTPNRCAARPVGPPGHPSAASNPDGLPKAGAVGAGAPESAIAASAAARGAVLGAFSQGHRFSHFGSKWICFSDRPISSAISRLRLVLGADTKNSRNKTNNRMGFLQSSLHCMTRLRSTRRSSYPLRRSKARQNPTGYLRNSNLQYSPQQLRVCVGL